MITRAKLQEKTLDELRQIADSLDVPGHETLQKTKLIAAIVQSDGFEASSEPAPIDLPAAEVRPADGDSGSAKAGAEGGEKEAAGASRAAAANGESKGDLDKPDTRQDQGRQDKSQQRQKQHGQDDGGQSQRRRSRGGRGGQQREYDESEL